MQYEGLAKSAKDIPANPPRAAASQSALQTRNESGVGKQRLHSGNKQPHQTQNSERPKSRKKWRWQRLFLNPTGRIRARLTREGYQFVFLMTFSLIAAIIQNVNLLVLLAGALGAMLFLQWRLCTRTLNGLIFTRNFPRDIEARRPFTIEIVITNPRPWLGAWWVVAHEKISSRKKRRSSHVSTQTLMVNIERTLPKSSSSIMYDCRCRVRGEYTLSRPELSTRFPISLMRGIRSVGTDKKFLVHPTAGQMESNWREALELPRLGQQERRLAMSGGDGEFFGLRSYRKGDAMRLIHWRSSAKKNELLVRQFERQENFELAIVLDLTEPNRADWKSVASNARNGQPDPTDEYADIAIELATTMARSIVQQQSGSVRFSIADGATNQQFRLSSMAQMASLLDRLATAESSNKSNFDTILQESLLAVSRSTPTIVISLRSQRDSQIDKLQALTDVSSRLTNLRWVNTTNQEWGRLFRRGFLHEA